MPPVRSMGWQGGRGPARFGPHLHQALHVNGRLQAHVGCPQHENGLRLAVAVGPPLLVLGWPLVDDERAWAARQED